MSSGVGGEQQQQYAPQTLVAGRAKRVTAGNRMSRLINQEEGSDDEFYKEYYGENVFLEEDSEFTSEEEEDESDEFDSDFVTEDEDEGEAPEDVPVEKKKRRANVYVDPLLKAAKRAKAGSRAPRTPKRTKPRSRSSSSSASRVPTMDRELKNLASSTGFRDKVEILDEDAETTRRRSRRRVVVKKREEQEQNKKEKKVRFLSCNDDGEGIDMMLCSSRCRAQ
ncbi:hypothetical protein PTSG_11575 [Salpingoeca rosetta]|uniref:Vps72/YL1 N-terminal domain-containing protein n=1 Tax=Salpingoeca rosetta (strain ATCC 50818 / BSB-021) TaxID=946362 RepID=F2TW46_SALR5|nr:uncharacterized protein PTSG_11575 [Salpingoeca rosetta]EGD72292.1 hypothetical protein PTSG_11575 [Salpingoeca rosetta]|eukprot:XP_004998862.1 hypothetical protein PTSG_11575 [Salpingoeca rosetta]